MKFLSIFLILLIFGHRCLLGQECFDDHYNLKGKVKLLEEVKYSLVVTGQDTVKDEKLVKRCSIIKIDSLGLLLESNFYLRPDKSYEWNHFTTYDSTGHQTNWRCYSDSNLFEDIDYTYKINENGYDKYWFVDNRFVAQERYEFDEFKRITRLSSFGQDSLFEGCLTWEYIDTAKLEIESWYDSDSSLWRRIEREKNDLGDEIEVKEISFPDSTIDNSLYLDYLYDSKMNWIRRSKYKNGLPELIMIRRIEYY